MDLSSLSRAVLSAALATTLTSSPVLAGPAAPATQERAAVKGASTQPKPAPSQDVQAPKEARPEIEVVFVLDTTGSMASLLAGAKQKIFSIASRIAQGRPTPRLKVGLVAYRDEGDDYVTKRFDLSDDLDTVFANLRGFEAGGGGDTPEHVGRGLGEAVSKLSWSQDRSVMKVIFLVGDAPPARRNDDWDFKHWAKRAREKHIVVNTVRCGGDEETAQAWKHVAKLTDGTFDTIDQEGGMVAVATPYDAELARVNAALASRTLYAGRAEAQAENRARAATMASLAPEAAAERISFMKKTRDSGSSGAPAPSAPKAVGGAVDLLEAPGALARVRDDELPAELKGLDKAAREAKVKQLSEEKKALEAQASKLAAEREAWLAKNGTEKDDGFDANVMKGVKAQAKKYGVTY
ncbi:VWA domain-containing protein [Myxococcus stipitatus]|uniref:vWA domain-containing protein n=1 Tax=Myxococcus stipitatus TaxID=83455 RepID=UPI001F38829B|nr:vWA domain-containing protein [Myxococcus stipitatus]MCE9669436.1 VWA domain-containing protein [Myxococcus stipitatus]